MAHTGLPPSGFHGVGAINFKYGGKQHSLGSFGTKEEAAPALLLACESGWLSWPVPFIDVFRPIYYRINRSMGAVHRLSELLS
jgi:hypothetical protein